MYKWRKLTEQQRRQILTSRQKSLHPWHSPPHFESAIPQCYHLSAACYEHRPIIDGAPSRLEEFEGRLMELFLANGQALYAWCVLPNHWHALVRTNALKETIKEIGQMQGRISFQWNGEDAIRGRKCWHRCADRCIRSDRHFHVARNYIHHNPVKHGYVLKWEEWPFSSAGDYIAEMGRDAVIEEWNKFPVLDMGKDWD